MGWASMSEIYFLAIGLIFVTIVMIVLRIWSGWRIWKGWKRREGQDQDDSSDGGPVPKPKEAKEN